MKQIRVTKECITIRFVEKADNPAARPDIAEPEKTTGAVVMAMTMLATYMHRVGVNITLMPKIPVMISSAPLQIPAENEVNL